LRLERHKRKEHAKNVNESVPQRWQSTFEGSWAGKTATGLKN
jgi:hypothetical protein